VSEDNEPRELQSRATSSIQTALNRRTKAAVLLYETAIKKKPDVEKIKLDLHEAALLGSNRALKMLNLLNKNDVNDRDYVFNKIVAYSDNSSSEDRKVSSFFCSVYYLSQEKLMKAYKWINFSQDFGITQGIVRADILNSFRSEQNPRRTLDVEMKALESFQVTPRIKGLREDIQQSIWEKDISENLGRYHYEEAKNMLSKNPLDLDGPFNFLVAAQNYGNSNATSALYNLGEKIEEATELGNKRAVDCYKKAVENSHPMSAFKLGWLAYRKKNFKEAYKYAQMSVKSALKTDSPANFWARWLLGNFYEYGRAVNKNETIALDYYYKEAYNMYHTDDLLRPFAAYKILRLSQGNEVTGLKIPNNPIKPIKRKVLINQVLKVVSAVMEDIAKSPATYNSESCESKRIIREARKTSGFFGIEFAYIELARDFCQSHYRSINYPITHIRGSTFDRYAERLSREIGDDDIKNEGIPLGISYQNNASINSQGPSYWEDSISSDDEPIDYGY
jgi:hypothetical protein